MNVGGHNHSDGKKTPSFTLKFMHGKACGRILEKPYAETNTLKRARDMIIT